MNFQHNDGGRRSAGFNGVTGDCVARSIAIVTGLPYQQVYDDLNAEAKLERPGKAGSRSTSRTGVKRRTYERYLKKLGYRFVACMGIGTGCKVHMIAKELPPGRIIVRLSRHLAAVIDGELHDIYDCTRNGTRCVYGYFTNEPDDQAEAKAIYDAAIASIDGGN